MMNTKKTISISFELYSFLKNQGKKGESFDVIIKRLIPIYLVSVQSTSTHTIPYHPSPSQSRPDQSYPDQSTPRQSKPTQKNK